MPDDNPQTFLPSEQEVWQLGQTLPASPPRNDRLLSRLQFVADLLADADPLPKVPLLLWRQQDGKVKCTPIGRELVVGRRTGPAGIELPDDKSLSSTHFAVVTVGDNFEVVDRNSRNGTRVNEIPELITQRSLRDGDLIMAGKYIFAFLDPRSAIAA